MKRWIVAALLLGLLPLVAPAQGSPPLLIGLVPETKIFKQKKRFQALGAHVSKVTGIEIRFTALHSYGSIVESFASEKLDGAFLGTFTGPSPSRSSGSSRSAAR